MASNINVTNNQEIIKTWGDLFGRTHRDLVNDLSVKVNAIKRDFDEKIKSEKKENDQGSSLVVMERQLGLLYPLLNKVADLSKQIESSYKLYEIKWEKYSQLFSPRFWMNVLARVVNLIALGFWNLKDLILGNSGKEFGIHKTLFSMREALQNYKISIGRIIINGGSRSIKLSLSFNENGTITGWKIGVGDNLDYAIQVQRIWQNKEDKKFYIDMTDQNKEKFSGTQKLFVDPSFSEKEQIEETKIKMFLAIALMNKEKVSDIFIKKCKTKVDFSKAHGYVYYKLLENLWPQISGEVWFINREETNKGDIKIPYGDEWLTWTKVQKFVSLV